MGLLTLVVVVVLVLAWRLPELWRIFRGGR
jgi:hypothetical protein